MKNRNLFFSLGAISAAAVTTTAVIGLTAISPLKLDPIATFAALVVAISGIAWFKKTSGKH
jgi:hypothetical protein